jgi:hypothetical protein
MTNHRADIIAGLRAAADFLEAHPDIPEPYTVDLQHSVTIDYDPQTRQMTDPTDAEKIAEVRRIGDLLGVETTIHEDGSGVVSRYKIASQTTYLVHANLTGGDRS